MREGMILSGSKGKPEHKKQKERSEGIPFLGLAAGILDWHRLLYPYPSKFSHRRALWPTSPVGKKTKH